MGEGMLNHQMGIVLRQVSLVLFCVALVTACGEPPSVPSETVEPGDGISDKNPGAGGLRRMVSTKKRNNVDRSRAIISIPGRHSMYQTGTC